MKTTLIAATFSLLFVALAGAAAAISYDDYAAVLAERVDANGLVDYAGLAADRDGLDRFVSALAALEGREYESWSPSAQLAFWINAYNALTLRLIVDHYPIRPSGEAARAYPANSIRQIEGAWDAITFRVMGEEMTLDHIEHAIIGERYAEPRVHMALVCAARSCPPLRGEPYAGDRLDEQLEDQSRRFVTDTANVRIDREEGLLLLSMIFDWFSGDFVPRYGDGAGRDDDVPTPGERAVLGFVSRYLGDEARAWLESGAHGIGYIDYDWALNEQERE